MSTDNLQSALKKQPTTQEHRFNHRHESSGSKIRFGLASILRMSDRLAGRVVSAYDQLFQLEEKDKADIYLNMGSDFVRDGKCEDAIVVLKRTLEIEPENAMAWYQLGMVYEEQQAMSMAYEAFTKAKALGVNTYENNYHIACTLADLDRHEESAEALRQALEIKPDVAEAHYRLGVELDSLTQYEEAAAAFRKAIDLAPRETVYYQSLGFTLETMGQRSEAIICFKKALELERRFER